LINFDRGETQKTRIYVAQLDAPRCGMRPPSTPAPQPSKPRTMTKAAIQYLVASGATAISVVDLDGVCTFQIAVKINAHAVETQWLPETAAPAIVKQARHDAGKAADRAAAIAALHGAAAAQRVTLTPHATAIDRAGEMVVKLDAFMDQWRTSGQLGQFNTAYRQRRMTASAAGMGFMSYKIAMSRLRTAMVPLLMAGGQPAVGRSVFEEVFR
jgi:hypothetical protein